MTANTFTACAYGEHLEGPHQRSLGFRLLVPAEPAAWNAEVDSLARGLQSALYPDSWPPGELFCSVILADGQRLIGVARYGLSDQTPSRRRSGFELLALVGPAEVEIPAALAVYQWLKQQRGQLEDLRQWNGVHSLENILTEVQPRQPPQDSLPLLPIRLWQEGALLFAATNPTDPDRRLGMLEPAEGNRWQWLPLVGADFPVNVYARRGPLIAWTPHWEGVAVQLERKEKEVVPDREQSLPRRAWIAAGVIMLLLCANLITTLIVAARSGTPSVQATRPSTHSTAKDDQADALALALYQALKQRGAALEDNPSSLLRNYEDWLKEHQGLRLEKREGKLALGAVAELTQRGPRQVESMVREALTGRGFDPALIDRACRLVYVRLAEQKSQE